MSDDNPYVIPEMDPTLRKQIQECNWQVVNVTTPANYFHVLRRQVSAANLLLFQAFWRRVSFLNYYFLYVTFFFHIPCLLLPDTQGIPEASHCDVPEELASTQGLQIKSV